MRTSLSGALIATLLAVGCSSTVAPTAPTSLSTVSALPSGGGSSVPSFQLQSARNDRACWGEATEVFARMGEMGTHASQQSEPRLGLRNVARALYQQGVIPDDTLRALGAFLSSAFGLTIESCL